MGYPCLGGCGTQLPYSNVFCLPCVAKELEAEGVKKLPKRKRRR